MLTQLLVICGTLFTGGEPEQWLPDLIVDPAAFSDRQLDPGAVPGRLVLRFRSSIPNIGLGEFRIVATGELAGDGVHQRVEQVIQWSDGSTTNEPLGDNWLYNPETFKMDVRWWVRYRIRELLPGDGVGRILAHGAKPEVNITSSTSYDLTLPNAPANRLSGFGPVQGISVGWTDIYPKSLFRQWVDVTHLPPGDYWLEMELDPVGDLFESDTTNNVARVIVSLDHPNMPPFMTHMADTDVDFQFSLSELLRIIQLYNSLEYHCLANTEDGYFPGPGDDTGCLPHSSDYNPQNWRINLSELLRAVQIFNMNGYTECPDSEDGFCPANQQ